MKVTIYGSPNDLALMESLDAALQGADALVTLTEWNVFRSLSFEYIKSQFSEPVISDGRNLYNPQELRGTGFSCYAIGRP